MALPIRFALRNLRQNCPVEAWPLLFAVGLMSSFGLSIAYSKASRAPEGGFELPGVICRKPISRQSSGPDKKLYPGTSH
ncbi:hypothetical protein M422DRAFT_33166 [Sphaerobolus stellatus SS14]|uniref:Uncharacterized protein n=1 Tax=Sphaerobolus stellatus (strain SS14) TaxID=990650 RepID=A0A0C9U6Z3_SPHS4|nr:hypothetical protein M422DRAFT_33166 [Sphaerobolus stellatus SS14]